MLIIKLLLTMLAATAQGATQDPDTGLAGDEGVLRSQAYVGLLPDSIIPRVHDALSLMIDSPSVAFTTLRNSLSEARQLGSTLLIDLDHEQRAPRLYCDLTVLLRRRVAMLEGQALEQYLSEAGAAGAGIVHSVMLPELVSGASAFPRTQVAATALARAADLFMERGDLIGARAAILRILNSGWGAAGERARLWKMERALAVQLGDNAPPRITDAELASNINNDGEKLTTLREWILSIQGSQKIAQAVARDAVKERWRAPVPPPALKLNLSEPIERVAADMGDAIAVQTLGDLLILDAKTGATRQRIVLDPAAVEGVTDPTTAANDNDKKSIFLGKRRARPSTDGRFVAATVGGAIWLYEKVGDRLELLWSKGSGKILTKNSAPDSKDAETRYYCDGAIVAGGRVFVTSIQLASDTSTFLDAFDPVSGERIFHRLIAKGSNSGAREERRFVNRVEAVIPQPILYHGGAILVATELGVVAAVDPLDGEILYILRIQRSAQPQGYEPSAPAASNGILYVSPSDSDYLYALEPSLAAPVAGKPAALPLALDRAPQRRRDALFAKLVGAMDTRAILYGREQQVRRTLTSFDFNPATRTLDNQPMGPGEDTTGLPVMIGSNMFIPTNHGITLYIADRPMRDLWQLPLPVDANTHMPMRGDEALGDLSRVAGGIVSCGKNWIICYDVD